MMTMHLYLTSSGYGFAHTHDADAARELGARTGLDVTDRCGGGAGVDNRDGSISVRLDAVPIDGAMQIREEVSR